MVEKMMNRRIVGIDFLRGVAVILVIFRHITWPSIPFLTRIGWAGVDLFFVLSGYLVTSLLMAEYQKTGKVNIHRFLIRRAFKIYPAHYVMIITTIISFPIINLFFPIQIGYGDHPFIGEFFYLQNYIGALWNHTWSLAVEEHFYILLCVFVYIFVRTKLIQKGATLMWIFGLLLLLVLILRITHSYDTTSIAFLSHFRMDSLVFGSVIAYILSFRAVQSTAFVRKHNKLLGLIAALLLMPILFLHPWSTFMLTYGANIRVHRIWFLGRSHCGICR
ncbi:MAG: acyltransferase family protein [Cytophagales bacterium]